jgi:hypothetical protein
VVVCLDSSFSLTGFALRAPHERKFGEQQDELLASLALFYKSCTTKECLLEIQESWLFSSQQCSWDPEPPNLCAFPLMYHFGLFTYKIISFVA